MLCNYTVKLCKPSCTGNTSFGLAKWRGRGCQKKNFAWIFCYLGIENFLRNSELSLFLC